MGAYRLAKENDGAPGIDGVTFEAIEAGGIEGFLEELREELDQRTYRPLRAQKVEIPKAGGVRQLSIPTTVLDRLIGQAISQVLRLIFDLGFSESSFGFRRGRSAHEARRQVQRYNHEGYRIAVDLDLEKFSAKCNTM
ncbi:MAG: reverse transcriptase domain-containing protein [Gammaproteobacteria bacterium]